MFVANFSFYFSCFFPGALDLQRSAASSSGMMARSMNEYVSIQLL